MREADPWQGSVKVKGKEKGGRIGQGLGEPSERNWKGAETPKGNRRGVRRS